MCRQQLNRFIERKERKIEDFCTTSLDYRIDKNNNVILSECSLCFVLNPTAYIFICGCKHVGLLCEHCLDWLEEGLFFAIVSKKRDFNSCHCLKNESFHCYDRKGYICSIPN